MLASIVTLLYLIAAGFWLFHMNKPRPNGRYFSCGMGLLAWVLHAWLLYQWIDLSPYVDATSQQRIQNLHVNNMFSLIIWAAILLVQLLSFTRSRLRNITVFFFPIAAGSVLLVQWMPGTYLLATGENISQLLHVLLAVATFSVLSVATLQAILVGVQDHFLRRKHVGAWLRIFPPLEAMESILHVFVLLGFLGLTLVFIGSLFALAMTSGNGTETHSPYLAGFSWLAFLMLLIGRRFAGWRGKTITLWTLVGVLILSVSYFGAWLVYGVT